MPGKGVLDMEPGGQRAPFPPAQGVPSDYLEFPGPRVGRSLTLNCNSEEGTGAPSASASSFAKCTSPAPQPLPELCERMGRVTVTQTATSSLGTQPGTPWQFLWHLAFPAPRSLLLLGLGRVHSTLCDSVFPVVKQKRKWLKGCSRTEALSVFLPL